jgi:hypothetical protein
MALVFVWFFLTWALMLAEVRAAGCCPYCGCSIQDPTRAQLLPEAALAAPGWPQAHAPVATALLLLLKDTPQSRHVGLTTRLPLLQSVKNNELIARPTMNLTWEELGRLYEQGN